MPELYYTPPTDKIFNEVKQKAIEVWQENYSDEHGYVSEKTEKIKSLENVSDNVIFIVAMFDTNNQVKLADKLNEEAKKTISDRMIDGGNIFNPFEE